MMRTMMMTRMIRLAILALSLFSFSETIASQEVPRNFTVGGALGWIVPPGGEIVYISWARNKTFRVGDALEFKFIKGTQDVAVVKKEDYEKCQTNNSIAVYSSSPVRIELNTTGEHFYTSTYRDHCALGQKLAINVTSNGSALSPPPQGA